MVEKWMSEAHMPEISYRPPIESQMMVGMPDMYQLPQMQYMPVCPCVPQETVLRDVRLARAYVPFQKLCTTFPPVEGLDKGTAFPELYSPYRSEDKWSRPPKHE